MDVPGTVQLVDSEGTLKVQHGRDQEDVVLVPAPSLDPEDPLNWSAKRRALAIWSVHLYTFIAGWTSAAVYSVTVDISRDTGLTIDDIVSGSGIMLLFFGWGCLFWQPVGLTFGRRGVYLLSLLLLTPISVWTAYSTTRGTWIAQRILLGFFGSPIETLPQVSVNDLHFVHQRGRHLGIWALALSGGAYIAPIAAGFIDARWGWQWVMFITAIIDAFGFVWCFFFLEETMFHRPSISAAPAPATPSGSSDVEKASSIAPSELGERPHVKPRAYLQKLLPFIYIADKPNEFVKTMWRPLAIVPSFPLIVWAAFIHGVGICALNALNATTSVVLSSPPYSFKSWAVGLTYIAPTIGCAVGAWWSGDASDKIALWITRRNKGVYEPEHRLWPAIACCIIPPAGFILWGVGASHGVHWVGLCFGLAMLGFCMSAIGTSVINYVNDTYKELAGETLMTMNVIRCTISFGFGYAVMPWINREGLQDANIQFAFITMALFATSLIVIKYGKRGRAASRVAYARWTADTIQDGR